MTPENQDNYIVSVICSTVYPEAEGAGCDEASHYELEPTPADTDDLKRLHETYGFNSASQHPISHDGVFPVWFESTDPRYDREYIELGIRKFYTLYIEKINGRNPTGADYLKVAKLFGVRT